LYPPVLSEVQFMDAPAQLAAVFAASAPIIGTFINGQVSTY
jgi:hypothetical protein